MTKNFLSLEYMEFLENIKDNVRSSRPKVISPINNKSIHLGKWSDFKKSYFAEKDKIGSNCR